MNYNNNLNYLYTNTIQIKDNYFKKFDENRTMIDEENIKNIRIMLNQSIVNDIVYPSLTKKNCPESFYKYLAYLEYERLYKIYKSKGSPAPVQAPVPTSIPTSVPAPVQVPVQAPVQAPVSVPVPASVQASVQASVLASIQASVPEPVPASVPTSIPTSVPASVPAPVPASVSISKNLSLNNQSTPLSDSINNLIKEHVKKDMEYQIMNIIKSTVTKLYKSSIFNKVFKSSKLTRSKNDILSKTSVTINNIGRINISPKLNESIREKFNKIILENVKLKVYQIIINNLTNNKKFNISFKEQIKKYEDIFNKNFRLLLKYFNTNQDINSSYKKVYDINLSYKNVYDNFIDFLEINTVKYFSTLTNDIKKTINILFDILLIAKCYEMNDLNKYISENLVNNISNTSRIEFSKFKKELTKKLNSITNENIKNLINRLPNIDVRYTTYSSKEVLEMEVYMRIIINRFNFIIYIWGGNIRTDDNYYIIFYDYINYLYNKCIFQSILNNGITNISFSEKLINIIQQNSIQQNSINNLSINELNRIIEFNIKNRYLYRSDNKYINIKLITCSDIFNIFNKFLIDSREKYFPYLSKDLQIMIDNMVDIYYKTQFTISINILNTIKDYINYIITPKSEKSDLIIIKKKIRDYLIKFFEFKSDNYNSLNILIILKIREYLSKIPYIKIDNYLTTKYDIFQNGSKQIIKLFDDNVFNNIVLYTKIRYNFINQIFILIFFYKKYSDIGKEDSFEVKLTKDFFENYLYNHYKKEYDYLSKKYKDLPTRIQNINIIKNKITEITKIDINGSIFAEILMNQLITKKTFYLNLDNNSYYYKCLIYLKLGQFYTNENKNKDQIINKIVTNIKKEIFNDIKKVIEFLVTSKNLNEAVKKLTGITEMAELEDCKKLKELEELKNIDELLKSKNNKSKIIENIISTIDSECDKLNNLNTKIKKKEDINEIIKYIIDKCDSIKEFIKISSCVEIIEILKKMNTNGNIESIISKKNELQTMEDNLKTMETELKTMKEKLKTTTKKTNEVTISQQIKTQEKNIKTALSTINTKKLNIKDDISKITNKITIVKDNILKEIKSIFVQLYNKNEIIKLNKDCLNILLYKFKRSTNIKTNINNHVKMALEDIYEFKNIFANNIKLLFVELNNKFKSYITEKYISYEEVYNRFISFLKIYRVKYFPTLTSEIQETINILSDILIIAKLYKIDSLYIYISNNLEINKFIIELPKFKTESLIQLGSIKNEDIKKLINKLPVIPTRYSSYSSQEIQDIESYIRVFNLRFKFIIYIWGYVEYVFDVEDKFIFNDFIIDLNQEYIQNFTKVSDKPLNQVKPPDQVQPPSIKVSLQSSQKKNREIKNKKSLFLPNNYIPTGNELKETMIKYFKKSPENPTYNDFLKVVFESSK